MGLPIPYTPGLEDEHPSRLLLGFCSHDRLRNVFRDVPEPIFPSHHRLPSMRAGVSYPPLFKSPVQNVLDVLEKNRFRQRSEDLPRLSCIHSFPSRNPDLRSPLYEAFGTVFRGACTEQFGWRCFRTDSLLPVGATGFFPFGQREKSGDRNDKIRCGIGGR